MAFHGLRADVQVEGDFLVSQPSAASIRDLLLPFGQLGLRDLCGRPGQALQGQGGHATIGPDLSRCHRADRSHEHREFELLPDETRSAGAQYPFDSLVARSSRQNENSRRGRRTAEAMHRALRVRSEPFVVENQDLGILLRQHFPDLVLIAGPADDGEARLGVELAGQGLTEKSGLGSDGDSQSAMISRLRRRDSVLPWSRRTQLPDLPGCGGKAFRRPSSGGGQATLRIKECGKEGFVSFCRHKEPLPRRRPQ